jgi:hypothetical protein
MFADVVSFFSDFNPFRRRFCHFFVTQWKIKINPFKTQAIYFTRCWAPRKLPSTNIKTDDHPMTWASEVKYLGVTLYKTFTFPSHTDKSIKKSEKAFSILYSIVKRKSKLNDHNKLLFYKTCIRSILCYEVEALYHCAYTHKKRLQIIQNKCLKIIMNRHYHELVPFDVHASRGN